MSAFPPAPWSRRAFALGIDLVGWMFIQLTLGLVIAWFDVAAGMSESQATNWFRFMDILTLWLYFAGSEASEWSATPGKRVFGLKTLTLDGKPLSFTNGTIRFAARPLSVILAPVALFMALRDPRRQLLHDRIAGTCVVAIR